MRRAYSLVEILAAVALVGVLVVVLLELIRGGARTAAKAGEAQIAAVLAGRIADRLLTNDYRTLRGLVDRGEDLELARLEEPGPGAAEPAPELAADPEARRRLVVDGATFTASYRVQEESPGLLSIGIEVQWKHPASTPGRLAATRLVANPAVGVIVP